MTDARFGAIELQRDSTQAAARANFPLAFNENRYILGTQRTADSVRSEAWEFMLNEGGLFDAYSLDRSTTAAQNTSTQLKALYDFRSRPQSWAGSRPTSRTSPPCNRRAATGRTTGAGGSRPGGQRQGDLHDAAGEHLLVDHEIQHGPRRLHPPCDPDGGTPGGYIAKLCGNGTPGSGFQSPGFQYRVPQSGCWAAVWIDPATGTRIGGGLINLTANVWNTPSTLPLLQARHRLPREPMEDRRLLLI